MRRLLFLFFVLMFSATTNARVTSNDEGPEKEIFDAIIAKKDMRDSKFTLTFSDGFKQVIKGPITIEEGERLRCPCAVYKMKFYDDAGNELVRKIKVNSGVASFEYSGTDGKAYHVDMIEDMASGEKFGKEPPKEICKLEGSFNKLVLSTRKMIPNDGKSCPVNGTISCLGEKIVKCEAVVECTGHPEYPDGRYQAFCISKDGRSCPSADECVSDEAYDKFVENAQQHGMDILDKNGKSIGVER